MTTKQRFLVYDTRDDRKEIFHLLKRLPPAKRIAFVSECCRKAVLGTSKISPRVAQKTRDLATQARWDSSADEKLTLDLFYDLWHLSVSYKFDLDAALTRLVEVVKGKS